MDVLLPHLAGVVVERVERTSSGMRIWACTKVQTAPCPSCGVRSGRVHSRYDRKLDDAPVAGRPVVLRLRVRRFFCDHPECEVGTFSEQVDGLTVGHARRTLSSRTALECIGLASAGRTGARLAAGLGLPTSRSTLLADLSALSTRQVVSASVSEDRRMLIELFSRMRSGRGFLNDLTAVPTDARGVIKPTLVIAGRNDGSVPFARAEALASAVPHGSLVESSADGHFIWLGLDWPVISGRIRDFPAA
ncbi:transposase family protein [Saccharothrix sp.]|uniref:transposase family protein n=1 Tax=Saccharothrix sp. TaxID=1873460 RepID=UPI0028112D40|nr:transposase family protein [Saccharothrix sp.]